jgi:hypothetical protein
VQQKKTLEELEQEVEASRSHLGETGDRLKESKPTYTAAEYQRISAALSELQSRLDVLDSVLFARAVSTDEPDKPLI